MKSYNGVTAHMKRSNFAALAIGLALTAGLAMAEDNVDSLKQQIDETAEKVEGMNELLSTLSSDLNVVKGVKLSGYLQARYEANDSSHEGIGTAGNYATNGNANNFYIRRGRAKITYQTAPSSKYVFYLDASKQSVSLKEAYMELIKRVGQSTVTLTVGQFNWPFGYEIEYSSSKRDFPERSVAENKLFKGERDRGANLTWALPKTFQFNLGVFQGWGIEGSDGKSPTWYDPTAAKDVIARAKVKLNRIDFGVSGYWGKYFDGGKAATAGTSTWYDANGSGQVDSGDVIKTTNPSAAEPSVERDKTRLGIDAQYYLEVLPIGGSAIRAELYVAKDFNKDVNGLSASEQGWYLWLSQTITKKFGAAIRYDYWDPEVDNDYKKAKVDDATGTFSVAGHYFWDSHVRITAAYDAPRLLKGKSTFSKSVDDVDDNRFTLQFQYTL